MWKAFFILDVAIWALVEYKLFPAIQSDVASINMLRSFLKNYTIEELRATGEQIVFWSRVFFIISVPYSLYMWWKTKG
jgi:hypothetical protein